MNKKQLIVVCIVGILILIGVIITADYVIHNWNVSSYSVSTINANGQRGGGIVEPKPILFIIKVLFLYFIPIIIVGGLLFKTLKNK